MACPAVATGERFLVQALAHIDCQAQMLGSFGYQTLALPGSPASLALTALLTLFIALYGIRLLFGSGGEPRDIVGAVLKVGIVLTLAASWPAWRILAYDTVLRGPAELAATMMPSTLPDTRTGFAERLQRIDASIAALTYSGTGRQTGEVVGTPVTGGFRAVALEDETGLAWSRVLYLGSVIGSLATLRIAAGLLLALAPLLAGLLLFDVARGLFAGWLKGLALAGLGSLGLTVLLSVQVALMEPWLTDILNRRSLGYATPAAPTELLALVAGFALATAGLLFLLGKVAFHGSLIWRHERFVERESRSGASVSPMRVESSYAIPVHSRAMAISESVASSIRREELALTGGGATRMPDSRTFDRDRSGDGAVVQAPNVPLGSGYRRTTRSTMASHRQRDSRA